MRYGAPVDQVENDFSRGRRDSRWVELVVGHGDLDGSGRLRHPPTAARGQQRERKRRHQSHRKGPHLNAVTPRERMPKRQINTTPTKRQYSVTAATPTR